MFKNFLMIILTLLVCTIFASPDDTITYRQRRASRIEKGLLDIQSGSTRVITNLHSHIHNYEAYSISEIDTLANNEKIIICIYTGSIEFHLKSVNVWAEGSPNLAFLIENLDTIRMSNDTLTPQNRNRDDNLDNSLFPSGCIVTDSVDTAGIGTNLIPTYFGGGSGIGQATFAGAAGSEIEWMWGDEQYIIIGFQNLSGGAKVVSINLVWYELPE